MILVYMRFSCKLRLKIFLIDLVYNNDNILKILDEMR